MDETYANELASGVERRFRNLEMEIMRDIIRRIGQARNLTGTAEWQIQRLIILGTGMEDLQGIIREAIGDNEEEIRRLYERIIREAEDQARPLCEEMGRPFIPYDDNRELQQITEALIRQSNTDLFNITGSMGFMVDVGDGHLGFTPMSAVYNEILDDAITGMVSGAYDYQTLVRRMTIQMTNSGVRSSHPFGDTRTDYGVDYASGWHNRIDVAARRALLTGFGQLSGIVTDMNAQALGTQTFEVSWHPGARPEHMAWQGKVYTKQQLYDICGLGTVQGLQGANCRHDYNPFIPGISERQWPDEWLEDMNRQEMRPRAYQGKEYTLYQATQRQRQIETSLRAWREKVQLLREGGADRDIIIDTQCQYQYWLNEYRRFSGAMGLQTQTERIYTGRTVGRIAPTAQQYAVWLAEREAAK